MADVILDYIKVLY